MRKWVYALGGWFLMGAAALAVTIRFALARPLAQPIAFNHAKHVREVGLDCQVCHPGAATGDRAAVVGIAECMNCHETVESASPEAKKVGEYAARGEEPAWRRAWRLPPVETVPFWRPYASHVWFTHRRHVTAGKLDCSECHPGVADRVAPVTRPDPPVRMSRCLSCHRERRVTTDCLACHR